MSPLKLDAMSLEELRRLEQELATRHREFASRGLALDLTRGKPSSEQLDLSNALDGLLGGDYSGADGTDTRNYGGLEGLTEMRALGAEILGVRPSEVIAGGNSSLSLMFQAMLHAHQFGFTGPESAWSLKGPVRFLCPVPGYDRHFSVCEHLGIEMLPVPMTHTGPDMAVVEDLLRRDPSIMGMWCVPKYSNPTGVVYSDETVDRIARLAKIASPHFLVFWDNAYAVHDLSEEAPKLASVMDACRRHGTEDSVLQFSSTSKISFAGAGVALFAASESNLASFLKLLGVTTIGPDKVNQLRHARLFPDLATLRAHMARHAQIIRPRFECVLEHLHAAFADNDLGSWQEAHGGYFISFDTRPGLARDVVKLAAGAGVKLTPAGATFPYGRDPENRNIRIAPTVPSVEQLDLAMRIFVVCVELASVRQLLV